MIIPLPHMDLNQWGWAESILRISTQIASREPLVTQYEGMLHGLLTDQILLVLFLDKLKVF